MSLNQVPTGKDVPNDFNVIIEIPTEIADFASMTAMDEQQFRWSIGLIFRFEGITQFTEIPDIDSTVFRT